MGFFKKIYDLYTYFSSREYDRHKIYCIRIKFCRGNEMEMQVQGERQKNVKYPFAKDKTGYIFFKWIIKVYIISV